MASDDLMGLDGDGVDEALARLMAQVEEEPVSPRLRELARQLADALAQHEYAPVPHIVEPGREAPHG